MMLYMEFDEEDIWHFTLFIINKSEHNEKIT